MRSDSGTRTEASAAVESAGDSRPGRLQAALGPLRLVCGAALLLLVAIATLRSWADVRATIALIGPVDLVVAEVLILVGLGLSALTWRRCLIEVGSSASVVAASRIYLVGQLGKYIPGSIWAFAAQTELGKKAGVPRTRGLASSIIAAGVNVLTGLALGLALVPTLVGFGPAGVGLLIALAAAFAVLLSPPVLTRLVNLGLRALKQARLNRGVTWWGIGVTSGLSVTSWISYGACVWVIAVSAGAPAGEALPLCLAGVPLAMTVGFLVVVTPSGLGVRDGVIVAALTPVLDRSDALAVALVARFLFTVADVLAAGIALPMRVQPHPWSEH